MAKYNVTVDFVVEAKHEGAAISLVDQALDLACDYYEDEILEAHIDYASPLDVETK